MNKVVIIGLGNLGSHLYEIFKTLDDLQVVQLYNRSIEPLKPYEHEVETTTDIHHIALADVYIISTADDAIGAIASQLPFTNRLVVHTSGSVPIQTLANTNRKGSFYPLQTFSKAAVVDFTEIPICIEAENEADLAVLEQIAKKLSTKVYAISSEQRKAMHLAAVFVNNFTNHMYHIGAEICKEHQVPFSILAPLIKETALKLDDLSPFAAQTGPAKRNDTATIQGHLEALTNTTHKEIYTAISSSITNTYGKKL